MNDKELENSARGIIVAQRQFLTHHSLIAWAIIYAALLLREVLRKKA